MRDIIISLKKVPKSPQELKNLLFDNKKFLTDRSIFCYRYNPADNYKDNIEEYEEVKLLDNKCGNDYYQIFKIDDRIEYLYDFFKKSIKEISKEEALKIITSKYFKGRPRYTDFLEDGYINWDLYFKKEKKEAEKIFNNFIKKRKDEKVYSLECFEIIIESMLEKKLVLEVI